MLLGLFAFLLQKIYCIFAVLLLNIHVLTLHLHHYHFKHTRTTPLYDVDVTTDCEGIIIRCKTLRQSNIIMIIEFVFSQRHRESNAITLHHICCILDNSLLSCLVYKPLKTESRRDASLVMTAGTGVPL